MTRILIVGNPYAHYSTEAFLGKFVNIIKELSPKIYLISLDEIPIQDNVQWIKPKISMSENSLKNIFLFHFIQFEIIWILIKSKINYDKVIILPSSYLVLSLYFKLINKHFATFIAQKPPNNLLLLLSKINFFISDLLITESNNVISDWNLNQYQNKIVEGSVYVDTSLFKSKGEPVEKSIIGYIGTLDERKGINELLESIKSLEQEKIHFIIAGGGILEDKVKNFALTHGNVEYVGILEKIDLPEFYNKLKLLVLPSYSEGLPNVVLEALACGVVVLATPVGAIPDIIIDYKTGFIIENNSSISISETIKTALNYDLECIIENGLFLISDNYNYQSAVKRYKKIIEIL